MCIVFYLEFVQNFVCCLIFHLLSYDELCFPIFVLFWRCYVDLLLFITYLSIGFVLWLWLVLLRIDNYYAF